jgi:hypothetical protein
MPLISLMTFMNIHSENARCILLCSLERCYMSLIHHDFASVILYTIARAVGCRA